MKKCNIDHSDYKNNGLITKIWGSPAWIFNHAITFGYPLEPTNEQKQLYRNYFISLGDILPCRYCRDSYKKFISSGETELTDNVMTNRETLTKWFYKVHEAVNAKLEVTYGMTYEDLVDKYESCRAKCGKPTKTAKGCVVPIDYKAFSFKKMYHIEAPIIPLEIVKKFMNLAHQRGLEKDHFGLIRLATELDGKIDLLRKQKCWYDRDEYCHKQIKFMRENGIMSIEDNGPWKGTPTIDELKLIMFLSSNLNRSELIQTLENLQNIAKQKIDFLNIKKNDLSH